MEIRPPNPRQDSQERQSHPLEAAQPGDDEGARHRTGPE